MLTQDPFSRMMIIYTGYIGGQVNDPFGLQTVQIKQSTIAQEGKIWCGLYDTNQDFNPLLFRTVRFSSTAQTKAKEKSQTLSAMTRHVSSNDSVR